MKHTQNMKFTAIGDTVITIFMTFKMMMLEMIMKYQCLHTDTKYIHVCGFFFRYGSGIYC